MRRQNTATVLRAVLADGPNARVELARRTGISSGTVTKLVADMIEADVLVERPEESANGGVGRPRVPVDLNLDRRVVLGLHIGATRSIVAALDLRMGVITERELRHSDRRPRKLLAAAIDELVTVGSRFANRRVMGLGVTSGGRVDPEAGVVLSYPGLGWTDVPVKRLVAQRFDAPVEFDEYVSGTALAEMLYGAARNVSDTLHLFVGHTTAAAMVTGGQLHRGAHGLSGGVTHVRVGATGPRCDCGRRGCFGQLASNPGILNLAQARGLVPASATYEDLLAMASDGDRKVTHILRDRARRVGEVVATLVDLLNPAQVILSGNADQWPDYFPTVEDAAAKLQSRQAAPAIHLRTSSFQHQPSVSAAALFLDRYFRDPLTYEPALRRRLVP